MILGMIGPVQAIVFGIVPLILVFLLGYTLGKKAGYIKRVKDSE